MNNDNLVRFIDSESDYSDKEESEQSKCFYCSNNDNSSDDIPLEYRHIPVKKIIRGVQELLLWRRPVALLFVFILTELMFYLIYTLHLDTLSALSALLISIHSACLLYSIMPSFIQSWIFPPIVENTVDDNVQHFFDTLKQKINDIIGWAVKYILTPNATDTLLFVGTSILMFTMFLVVGSFWSFFISVNSLFFLPAFFLNPNFRRTVDGKIRAAKNAVIKEKND